MLTSLLLIIATAVMPLPALASWSDSASVTGSPEDVLNGETVTFSFGLTINAVEGVDTVNITSVTAQFEWVTETLFSGIETVTSYPATLNYEATVTIPADLAAGPHDVVISVTATENEEEVPASADLTYIYRSADAALSADPSADVTTVSAPGTVSFNANAAGGTPPYTYDWTFGDGGTGSGATPGHTYTEEGTYTARVTVTDQYGRTAAGNAPTVTVTPSFGVTASASATSGTAPLTVDFTGTTSNGRAPYTNLWRFGDGATSAEAEPTHVYDAPGTYDASLTVSDADGKDATSPSVRIVVSEPSALEVEISASATSGDSPLDVSFTSSVKNATGALEYDWTFGDGTSSSEESPQHTFLEAGKYTVHLNVADPSGRSASAEIDITVTSNSMSPGPIVRITQSVSSGAAPLRVQFNSSVSDGTPPYFYRWDFGDGTAGGGDRPAHTYGSPGTYRVTLTVTDSDSNVVSSDALVVTVSVAGTTSAGSLDWTTMAMLAWIAIFVVAGLLLVRPRR
jgi:PKD repeat protein